MRALEPVRELRIRAFAVELCGGESAGSLAICRQAAAIGSEAGDRPSERRGIAGRVGNAGGMLVDQPLEFARKGVHEGQARRSVVAGLVGHGDERLGLHAHEPHVAPRQKLHISRTRQEPVHFEPAGTAKPGSGAAEG